MPSSLNKQSRRDFIKTSGTGLAAASILGLGSFSTGCAQNGENLTIQQAIDRIIGAVPGAPKEGSVDTVKCGDPNLPLTGIATTFLATVDVIRQAAEKRANLIITHEPTYYNHHDETKWLEKDPVYAYKRELLNKHQIVVWRFHDYWHLHRPDGILHGFLDQMGWQNNLDQERENICVVPETDLQSVAKELKEKLALGRCFIVGDPALKCRNIGLLPGAWGRDKQIELLRENIEVLVVGEVSEWETAEYVRDAAAAGMKKGLVVLGHALSEEPGMAYAKDWLEQLIPGVQVYHIASTDPFRAV